jgi:hypothetical protein
MDSDQAMGLAVAEFLLAWKNVDVSKEYLNYPFYTFRA